MEIGVSVISSKGQVVIPLGMRKNFREGEKVFFIKEDDRIIMKNQDSVKASVLDDLEFARRTEAAYKRVEAGEFISIDSENLEEEMSKW
jgi:bifunctional DNA-binding transcriptional regulator/antitoxin component of YhaV-PrlF toxin-antitoxin module